MPLPASGVGFMALLGGRPLVPCQSQERSIMLQARIFIFNKNGVLDIENTPAI